MKRALLITALSAGLAGAEPLSLDQALEQARHQHPSLDQSRATLDVMSARFEQSRGVLLPQVNASGIFSRAQGSFARVGSGTAAPTSSGITNLFSFGLSATQTLWDFGAIERLRVAGFNREAQQAAVRATQVQVDLVVRRAYFTAAAQRALVDVAQTTVDNSKLHLKQAEALMSNGRNTGIDVAQTKTQVANAELLLINAKNAHQLALVSLAQAMGATSPTSWQVDATALPTVEHEDDAVDELVKLAIEQRPEVATLRKQQEAWVAQRLANVGGFVPTLNANGSVSEGGTALDTLQPNWAFGVTLQWNLFNGLQSVGQIHESEAQARVVKAQLDAQALQVRTDVEQAQASVFAQRAAMQAAQTALTSAQEQLKLAEARLAAGVGSALEVGDAQVQFTTASAQVVQAQLNLSTARAQLLAALGVSS